MSEPDPAPTISAPSLEQLQQENARLRAQAEAAERHQALQEDTRAVIEGVQGALQRLVHRWDAA